MGEYMDRWIECTDSEVVVGGYYDLAADGSRWPQWGLQGPPPYRVPR